MRWTGKRLLWAGGIGILAMSALTSWFEVYVYESWWSRILDDALTTPFLGIALIGVYVLDQEKRKDRPGDEREREDQER